MKKISFYILIIVFFSCEKNNTVKKYSNGVLVSEEIKINDSLVKCVEYYSNSRPSKEYYLLNNKKEKEYIEYFKNGDIFQKGLYFNNLKEGYWKTFDSTGNLIKVEYFNSNRKTFLIEYRLIDYIDVLYKYNHKDNIRYTNVLLEKYFLIKDNKKRYFGGNFKNSKRNIIDYISDYPTYNINFDTIKKTNYKNIYFKFFKNGDEKVRLILGSFDDSLKFISKINGDTILIGFNDKYTYKVQALKLGLNKIQGFVQYVNPDSTYRSFPFFVNYYCIDK